MIVFTDAFTVGADIDAASYPSGSPDYSYLLGSAGDVTIFAATDRFEVVGVSDKVLRLLDVTCPTGDQQLTATFRSLGGFDGGTIQARCASGTADCYLGGFDKSVANEVQLWRVTTSAFTLIADGDRGFANVAATHTGRIKATGTNPVNLELQMDATANVTFADSAADRKQSGRNGVGGGNAGSWVDDVSVDDLVPTPNPDPHANERRIPVPIAALDGWGE